MANNYFQFKQFIVHQDHCAMKVCTDACIFGAYIAGQVSRRQPAVRNVLDIGTGTGLLSLMLAQQTSTIVDAIEIEEAAFQQATINFQASSWINRLTAIHGDVMQFNFAKKFDAIISNPPFFEGDLKSSNNKKNAAKHDTTLTFDQLLSVTGNILSPDGFLAVLVPWHRASIFIEKAIQHHFFLNEQLLVKHTQQHPFFRAVLFFSRLETVPVSNELAIKETAGNYTPEFIDLLKDYYLE